MTVLACVILASVVPFFTGCGSKNGTSGNRVSHVPSVNPLTVPLPSNIPPDQQALIRRQQAAAYAEGQAAQQRAQAAQRH
jgi:hypothetical protein